jgi:hypothetical protein
MLQLTTIPTPSAWKKGKKKKDGKSRIPDLLHIGRFQQGIILRGGLEKWN